MPVGIRVNLKRERHWSWVQIADLDKLDVENHTSTHRALFTVEEAKTVPFSVPGAPTKNLFLRNKKGQIFLVVID